MRIKSLVFSIALVVKLGFCSDYTDEEIGKVRNEVEANSKSVAGAQFAKTADSLFQSSQLDSIKNCFEKANGPDKGKLEAFFMLSLKGRIKDLFFVPASEQGKCFAAAVEGFFFPPPPGPNYWIRIILDPKPLKK